MLSNQIALIRREFWEHRSLYVTPAVLALFAALGTLTEQAFISSSHEVIDLAILGGSNIGEGGRGALISAVMFGVTALIFVGMWFLSIFYPLDALYAERKDRSILFWRSTPCTDFETVLSKLLTVLIVVPLITFAVAIVTHFVVLLLWSIWLAVQGGDSGHLIWSSVPFFDNWMATLVILFGAALWASPLIGWFLFVSAFTKRSPLLTAFLPLVVIPMLEKIVFGTTTVGGTVSARVFPTGLFKGIDPQSLFDKDNLATNESIGILDLLNLDGFFGGVEFWLGLIVCALFTTAAIYVRRYRDES